MKNLIFFTFTLFAGTIYAQNVHKQTIKSEINAVKLYLTAGQMTHEQSIKLKKGRNRLVFAGISVYADPQSIQFLTDGNSRLVSVSTEMDFTAAEVVNPRIGVLKDSLDLLKDMVQLNQDELSAYYAEEGILNTNKDLGGESKNLTVTEIKEAADFYRSRTLEIKKAISALRKENAKYQVMIENTRFQLVELNYNENQRSNQVVILLDSDADQSVSSSLSYLVSDCGWAATYDLSAEDINKPVNLVYKAQVYNNTGKEWKDVQLTLSTGDPKLSASLPDLNPWYLTYYNYDSYKKGRKNYYAPQAAQQDYRSGVINELNVANQRVYDNYYLDGETRNYEMQDNAFKLQQQINPVAKQVQMKQIQISELTTEFEIEKIFSCPSDAKPYMVQVKNYNLDATFSHITIPKLDRSAFLLAHITGWQELDLIPGPTRVYFSGVYVGVSEIDTRNVSDTLSLSFGRDEKVTVMRKLKKELSSKSVIGNTKKESYLYEIAIRNNRQVPIRIEVFDQVPISRSSDISVSVDELSNGTKDDETGEVEWKMNIDPATVNSREIGYSVRYPKNVSVSVRTFRTISSPSF